MVAISKERPLEVAVIGGGMGGLCLAIGLLKFPHIHVQVYEAAHKFSEIGAGIGLGPNAQRVLKLMGPDLEQAFKQIATVNHTKENSNTFLEYRFGTGAQAGEFIAAPKNETGFVSVHRAKFLDNFIKLFPEKQSHFGKRLTGIKDLGEGNGLEISFAEGESVKADCVIGADGIHSAVRKEILGKDHPAANPQFADLVAYRALVPMEEAKATMGEYRAITPTAWVGKGGSILHYPIDLGETLNFAVLRHMDGPWEGPWVVPAEYEEVAQHYAEWDEQCRPIVKLLDRPGLSAWAMWDLPSVPTYYKGNVVMMGDAAHAMTPFQAQGASQAFEDAFVLHGLIGNLDATEKIPLAFQAFDKIRRPRAAQVVKTSREAVALDHLELAPIFDNKELFREHVDWRFDWIWHRDIQGELDQSMIVYEKLVKGDPIS